MGWHLTIALVLSPYEYKLQQYKRFKLALFYNNNCLRRRELNHVAKSEKRVWIFFIAGVYKMHEAKLLDLLTKRKWPTETTLQMTKLNLKYL